MENEIRKILKDWKKESGSNRVMQYKYRGGRLTIYTSQPGYIIGKGGATLSKYNEILKEKVLDLTNIDLVETAYNQI